MRYHEIAGLPSVKTIEALRPEIAREAQEVYDAWTQDEDGYDEEYAGGGICHVIADRIVDVLSHHGVDCTSVSSNYEVHVYVVARCAEGVFEVDIPYRNYEIGGGYTWTKIPDVHFTPDFVHISHLDSDPNRFGMYAETDDLMEAPIQDIHVMGDPKAGTSFEQGTGFDPTDQKMITRGRDHYIRAFNRTPHVFEIFFINDADINANRNNDNNSVDDYSEAYAAGIHDEALGVKGKPGVIRHVQISNLSGVENRIPMTPWILAHKIAHAIQDSLNEFLNDDSDIPNHIRQINRQIYNIALVISGEQPFTDPIEHADIQFGFPHFKQLVSRLTMKSARAGRLDNPFEVWAEMIAQYLIRGRVVINAGGDVPSMVRRLNELIRDMFVSLEGKVTLEV